MTAHAWITVAYLVSFALITITVLLLTYIVFKRLLRILFSVILAGTTVIGRWAALGLTSLFGRDVVLWTMNALLTWVRLLVFEVPGGVATMWPGLQSDCEKSTEHCIGTAFFAQEGVWSKSLDGFVNYMRGVLPEQLSAAKLSEQLAGTSLRIPDVKSIESGDPFGRLQTALTQAAAAPAPAPPSSAGSENAQASALAAAADQRFKLTDLQERFANARSWRLRNITTLRQLAESASDEAKSQRDRAVAEYMNGAITRKGSRQQGCARARALLKRIGSVPTAAKFSIRLAITSSRDQMHVIDALSLANCDASCRL